MVDSITEILEDIKSEKDKRLNAVDFRTEIFVKLLEKDKILEEVFKDQKWVHTEMLEIEDGKQVAIVSYEPYLEKMFGSAMDEFNDENQDLAKRIITLAEKTEKFEAGSILLESFYSDDEVEEAKKKARGLVKEYAKKNGWKILKARMQMPSFPDIFDTISWLEGELTD